MKRTTVQFDDDDVRHFELMREVLAKSIPTPFSDQQLLRILMKKGFDAFARENGIQPELPLKESSTTKQKAK